MRQRHITADLNGSFSHRSTDPRRPRGDMPELGKPVQDRQPQQRILTSATVAAGHKHCFMLFRQNGPSSFPDDPLPLVLVGYCSDHAGFKVPQTGGSQSAIPNSTFVRSTSEKTYNLSQRITKLEETARRGLPAVHGIHAPAVRTSTNAQILF